MTALSKNEQARLDELKAKSDKTPQETAEFNELSAKLASDPHRFS